MKTFDVKCYLCDGTDDIRKMTRFQGQYYHNIKIPTFKTTCLQAVKNNIKKR